MRKMKHMLALLLALTMLLGLGSISALAAVEKPAADSVGIYELKVADNYKGKVTLKPQYEDGTNATSAYAFYENAVQVEVTYSDAKAGNHYMVFALTTAPDDNGAAVPTQSNMMYLNQVTPESTTAKFQVYPMELEAGKTYYIYLSSNASSGVTSIKQVASFVYCTGGDVNTSYVLGDVTNDGTIDAQDALRVLRIAAKLYTPTETEKVAADVTGDGAIDAQDALRILRYAAKLIDEF